MAETQDKQRNTTELKDEGIWKTIQRGPQQRRRRMTTEAMGIQDNAGIADKVRGGYRWKTIAAEEMLDNEEIGDRYTGRWRRQQRQRRRTVYRRYAGTAEIAVLG